MIPENRVAPHPGEVLREEFLRPLELSETRLASHLGCDKKDIAELVGERSSLDARLAWLLAMALGTTPEFWLNPQAAHDLSRSRPQQEIPRLVS